MGVSITRKSALILVSVLLLSSLHMNCSQANFGKADPPNTGLGDPNPPLPPHCSSPQGQLLVEFSRESDYQRNQIALNDVSTSPVPTIRYAWNPIVNGHEARYHNRHGNACNNPPYSNFDEVKVKLVLGSSGYSVSRYRVLNSLDDSDWTIPSAVTVGQVTNQFYSVNTDDLSVASNLSPACFYSSAPRMDVAGAVAPHTGTFKFIAEYSNGCYEEYNFNFRWVETGPGHGAP